jgi:hypothetical protein
MKELEPHDFNESVKKIFHLLSIRGHYKIIGSAKLAHIKYSSDYDLQEHIQASSQNHYPSVLLSVFRRKFEKAESNPSIFITDLKCGEIAGNPIRWNKSTIKTGKQKVNKKQITFQECILMKSMIKLDVVVLIHGVFVEFSENYYFNIGGHTNYEEPQNIQKSLLQDAHSFFLNKKLFKATKRIFSFLLSEKRELKLQQTIVSFFNSQVGFLNKNKTELEILLTVLNNSFRKPSRTDIVNNLQMIKQNINRVTGIDMKDNISETIDLICRRRIQEMKSGIEVLKSYLQKKINEATWEFLDKNKSVLKYINKK